MKQLLLFLFLLNGFFGYSQSSLAKSNNEFACSIFKGLKIDNENLFISPFSLNLAFSVVNEGTKGKTRLELDNLLGVSKIKNRTGLYEDWINQTSDLGDQDYLDCAKYSPDSISGNSLFIANSLWLNKNIRLKNNFLETAKIKYNSEIFSFNPQKMSAENDKLEKWISEKTDGNIKKMSGLNSNTQLSILNSIYFLGEWDNAFDVKKTKKSNFHTIQKEKVKLDFMKKEADCAYFETNTFQSISLPYKCNQFSMLFILPKKKYGLTDIEINLDSKMIEQITQSSKSEKVIMSIPKFRIESEVSPKESLVKMGFGNMFSDNANFSGVSDTPLKVGGITHKTVIEVSEKSTEASGATEIEMVMVGYGGGKLPPPPVPKVFNANHAFSFLIIDNRTNSILFIGRFVK